MYRHRRSSAISRLLLVSFSSLVLYGCASLGKKDCLSGDWGSIGFDDGADGKVSADRLASHAKACAKHGVVLDEALYQTGYDDGLKTYCTTENGYSVGSEFEDRSFNRSGYNNVCPVDLRSDFLTGYVNGLKFTLDTVSRELTEERAQLDRDRAAFLILIAVSSSKAEDMEQRIEETEESINENESTMNSLIKEIDKWVQVDPELEKLLR